MPNIIINICLAGYLTSFGSIFPSHESAKKKCEKRVKCPAVLSVKSFNRIYIAAEPQRGSTFFACIEIWGFSQMFVGRLPMVSCAVFLSTYRISVKIFVNCRFIDIFNDRCLPTAFCGSDSDFISESRSECIPSWQQQEKSEHLYKCYSQ